ncbi:MAG: hypothetical protein ACFKPT_08965 [Gloeotrichia echinulata GP01]
MTESITTRFLSVEGRRLYSKVISNYQKFLVLNIILILVDLTLLIIPKPNWLNNIEFVLSVLVAITTGWLSSRLFKRFYDTYGSSVLSVLNLLNNQLETLAELR